MSLSTACIQCDLPLGIPAISGGQRATCPRCAHVLSAPSRDGFNRATALSTSALVLLVLANSFPFLSLHSRGLESVMTLPHSAVVMYEDGYVVLAVIVLAVIIFVPALVLLTVLSLVVPLERGRNAPWLVAAGRGLFLLTPWSMAEVFIIGVIVSLVKITHMAHVTLGLAFWSYAGFTILFTATLASLDRLEIWERIEACRR